MSNGKIYEIAILGRAMWQLHSLNNEGSIGNVTEPRSVKIMDSSNRLVTTDGISGEMLKHFHTRIVWTLANNKDLCSGCRALNPEKFNMEKIEGDSVEKVVKNALKKCIICDLHGFLIPQPTVSRKSTIEFAWAVGIPKVGRDIHTHARQALGEKSKVSENEGEERSRGTQMIYHRPTRSGIYAIISLFQPWRIGLNEAREEYAYDIKDEERNKRYGLALRAYQHLFARPEFAMSTTRLPHVGDFQGLILRSESKSPLPLISPLRDDYIQQAKDIVKEIGNSTKIEEFKSISEFIKIMGALLGREPYNIFGDE
ncbi:MAG: DevR family CRISPR-associated autoregulator [Candidatus Aenigmatarchaeota archaeon]